MNGHDLRQPHQELRSLLGTRFSTDAAVRDAHARDASYHRGALPDKVAIRKSRLHSVKTCSSDMFSLRTNITNCGEKKL